jgi:hypothetical protein
MCTIFYYNKVYGLLNLCHQIVVNGKSHHHDIKKLIFLSSLFNFFAFVSSTQLSQVNNLRSDFINIQKFMELGIFFNQG